MLISGKSIAASIQEEIRKKISSFSKKPGLAFILVGEHPPSYAYVNMKKKACALVGITSFDYALSEKVGEKELLDLIHSLNQNPSVDGILIQLPLPAHLSVTTITAALDPAKDVDGFHPLNMGKLLLGQEDGFIPCTPLGIKTLLEHSNTSPEGKHVVIVGRSSIVGAPLAALLMQKKRGCNATVTVAHSKTKDLSSLTLTADILVAAIGSPRFIKASMVKKGAVVIDVGINREEDPAYPQGYHIVGDVDFNAVEPLTSAITPVPRGIGPMTIAMLLQNTLTSFLRRQ